MEGPTEVDNTIILLINLILMKLSSVTADYNHNKSKKIKGVFHFLENMLIHLLSLVQHKSGLQHTNAAFTLQVF